MISEAFKLGGWGMYPVLILGALMLGSAVWYAMNPERKRLLLPFVLAFVTFCSGTLGFLTGVMVSISHAADTSDMLKFVALGAAEALNCLTFALAWNVLAGLVVAVGAYRAARQTPNAEQAPSLAEARS